MAVEKLYISVSEAVERYGICRASLYNLFVLDDCPALRKFGGKTLIPVKEFDEFFEAQLTAPKIVQSCNREKAPLRRYGG